MEERVKTKHNLATQAVHKMLYIYIYIYIYICFFSIYLYFYFQYLILQVLKLRLATMKGHSKICSILYWGGGGGSAGVVECWSTSMAVQSYWILAGTRTRCRMRRSRASQTCSMGDMSGEYAGHATGMFSASRNCVQILATWGHALSCCNMR